MEDDFIEMKNTQENFDAYSGEIKEIAFCEGDHNSERPDEIKDQILKFFIKHLKNWLLIIKLDVLNLFK